MCKHLALTLAHMRRQINTTSSSRPRPSVLKLAALPGILSTVMPNVSMDADLLLVPSMDILSCHLADERMSFCNIPIGQPCTGWLRK